MPLALRLQHDTSRGGCKESSRGCRCPALVRCWCGCCTPTTHKADIRKIPSSRVPTLSSKGNTVICKSSAKAYKRHGMIRLPSNTHSDPNASHHRRGAGEGVMLACKGPGYLTAVGMPASQMLLRRSSERLANDQHTSCIRSARPNVFRTKIFIRTPMTCCQSRGARETRAMLCDKRLHQLRSVQVDEPCRRLETVVLVP